jgi:hypothetical protein
MVRVKQLLSGDHFSVDGTLIDAWASMKSFRPKDGSGEPPAGGRNGERDFHKEKRSNETQASTTDPDARLFREGDGRESRLCFIGHALMENRNGRIVDAEVSHATGTAERDVALAMIDRTRKPGRRQAVRHGRLRDKPQGAGCDAARRHRRARLQDWSRAQDPCRRPHHKASGLCLEPCGAAKC